MDVSPLTARERGRRYNRNVPDLEDLVGEQLMIGLPGPTLRDEDWRSLVDDGLNPEIRRLMSVAEVIHDEAKSTPT